MGWVFISGNVTVKSLDADVYVIAASMVSGFECPGLGWAWKATPLSPELGCGRFSFTSTLDLTREAAAFIFR